MEWSLEHYHDDKQMLEDYIEDFVPSCVPSYGSTPVKSGTADTTSAIGIKLATNQYIDGTRRTIAAIERALSKCDEQTEKLIDIVYWQGACNVEGACMKTGMAKSTAYNKINAVLEYIACELGYINR